VKASHRLRPQFDNPNLVPSAGLAPALVLAQNAGFHQCAEQALTVDSPNAALKAGCVVAGMLAGADTVDGLGLLRAGATARAFTGVRAPSTLGTFLRSFTFGHVRQLDRVAGATVAGLVRQVPDLLAGHDEHDEVVMVDVDDTVRQVYGYAKQAAGYGYTGVKGLNVQVVTVSTEQSAPLVLDARCRKGATASGSGSAAALGRALAVLDRAGARAMVVVRADSAFYRADFVAAAVARGAWFSVTAPMNKAVTRAVASIDEGAWTAIAYPQAVWEQDLDHPGGGYWVSDAAVAQVPFVAFSSKKKTQVPCHLVVRRVKRLAPRSADGTNEQGELFDTWRHHAFITNTAWDAVHADACHRDHAIVEQVIAELKDGPLAHMPSGSYAANAAWTVLATIAFNLARALAVAAGHTTARWATVRRTIINVPATLANTAHTCYLHMPTSWPWAGGWLKAWHTAQPAGP